MTDSLRARLSSSHLEDLALVALTAWPARSEAQAFPTLDDAQRARLRSRLKQIGRHDWPASLKEDPLLRRGYTLRQCFRLVVALLLIDAQLPPSTAVPIAANNELTFIRLILERLRSADSAPAPSDSIAVVLLGELWEQVDPQGAAKAKLGRVRIVQRNALANIWSADAGLDVPGQRLILDVGASGRAVWACLQHRRLLPADELHRLADAIEHAAGLPGFVEGARKITRRKASS